MVLETLHNDKYACSPSHVVQSDNFLLHVLHYTLPVATFSRRISASATMKTINIAVVGLGRMVSWIGI